MFSIKEIYYEISYKIFMSYYLLLWKILVQKIRSWFDDLHQRILLQFIICDHDIKLQINDVTFLKKMFSDY